MLFSSKNSKPTKPGKAQVFQAVVLVLGAAMVVRHSLQTVERDATLFLVYLGLSVLTSLLRVGVPTVAGTISVGFIFVLASMVQLELWQTITIGVTGTIVHCLRGMKRVMSWPEIAFQTAVAVLAIGAASTAYQKLLVSLPNGGAGAALPLAGTILFLMTAFPLAANASLSEGELLRKVWQNRFLWSLPYYLAGAALAGLLTAVVHLPVWQTGVMIVPLLFLVYRSYGLQLDALARERLHAEELATLQLSMVEALALAVESKDISAVDHLHRMALFSVGVGREVGLQDIQLKALRAAAVLHDIGQVAVPDHIIMKPGRLTPEEFERLKVHPDVGADIIDRAHFPYPVAPIVRAHHERWDGSGYPRGTQGEDIPLEARVLAAVDTLVALTSDRHHRRALPLGKAMATIREESGRGLDPAVVDALERVYEGLNAQADADRQAQSSTAEPNPDHADSREAPAFLATIAAARREEQSLLEFSKILGSSLNLHETLSALARRFRRQIPYDTMVLFLERRGSLEVAFIEGENQSLFEGVLIKLGEGVSGAVAARRKPAINSDPVMEPIGGKYSDKAARLRSALSVPLDGPQGSIGALTFYSERRNAFTASQLSLLLAITPKLSTTVENSIRFKDAENQATFDFLTGLPNAGTLFVHLQNELARCARGNSSLAVLMCDLDGFKQVNDRFGHLTGNKLLQAVGQGLKEHCREYDFVARMGGDEFVVILPGATDEAVRKRRRQLSLMVEQSGLDLCGEQVVGLSAGISFFPESGRTAEELLALADTRMYEDKALRKSLRLTTPEDTAHAWLPHQD